MSIAHLHSFAPFLEIRLVIFWRIQEFSGSFVGCLGQPNFVVVWCIVCWRIGLSFKFKSRMSKTRNKWKRQHWFRKTADDLKLTECARDVPETQTTTTSRTFDRTRSKNWKSSPNAPQCEMASSKLAPLFSWFEVYRQWVAKHPDILSQVESLGRISSYLIAGKYPHDGSQFK